MGRNFDKILKEKRDGRLAKALFHKIRFEAKYILMYFLRFYWGITTKIEKGKILFLTFQGTYTCNPKYICEALIRNGYKGTLVWVIDDIREMSFFPEQVQVVQRGKKEYYKALYSANIWIDNAFNITREPVWKRKTQVYIETMHGALGIKRIGPDKIQNNRRNKRGYDCGKLSDYIISNSLFEEQVYRESFWSDTEILPYGHARNDILLVDDTEVKEKIVQKVRNYFHMDNNQRIVLYAPTFRDYEESGEKIDFDRLIHALEQKMGGSWVIIERRHHRNKSKKSGHDRTLDGNQYPDIQELMLAADIGITDYSSWIFDFLLQKKPGFLYVMDEERYDIERGFYYPLKETPFPVAHNNKELEREILLFEEKEYQCRITDFLQARGSYEDGSASNKIVNKINVIVEG